MFGFLRTPPSPTRLARQAEAENERQRLMNLGISFDKATVPLYSCYQQLNPTDLHFILFAILHFTLLSLGN
mgnify:CR=1 FL=1